MRILTSQEFLKEPYGTVYIHYVPHTFIGEPKIKAEPRTSESWWATDILPIVVDNDEFNRWYNCHDYELETEIFCTDDSNNNHRKDLLFAVFNKDEIKGMIDRLIETFYEYDVYNTSKEN